MGKTKDLGELGGKAKLRKPVGFFYFGQPMRTSPLATELHLVDFLAGLERIDIPEGVDINDPESFGTLPADQRQLINMQMFALLPSVRRFLARMVHEDDFPVLWQTALDNGQEGLDLLGLCMTLLNASTSRKGARARPTKARPESSTGRAGTKKKSVSDSAQRVIERFENEGRPDLAEVVLLRQEALQASG